MGKYFKEGLTREELDSEYKKLAKQYHPDVSKDPKANEIMAAINNEYDEYFNVMRYMETGYNDIIIRRRYEAAAKVQAKKVVLTYMVRNKGKKDYEDMYGLSFDWWCTYSMKMYDPIRIISDDKDESWKYFRGGFAVVEVPEDMYNCQATFATAPSIFVKGKKLPYEIEFPDYGDMYFHMHYGNTGNESTALANSNQKYDKSSIYNDMTFDNIVYNGCHMWIRKDIYYGGFGKPIPYTKGYMKVNGIIMECIINFDIKKYSEFVETVNGEEFGYYVFQECSKEEFKRTHDVGGSKYEPSRDYEPDYADAVDCRKLNSDTFSSIYGNGIGSFKDLYWIDDPLVAHFARSGVVEFFQSKYNFKMRWGRFNEVKLEENLHLMSIDDAERIQDFLDDLNGSFEEEIKRMIKKGKIKVDTYLRDAWGRRI